MKAEGTVKHANHFNLLRLGLALLVLLSHAPELRDGDTSRELLHRVFHTLSFGNLAVAGFFILSGYLITQSWERNPKIFPFLTNRILRIYPGFVVASVLSILVAGWLTGAAGFFSELSWSGVVNRALTLRFPTSPPVYPGQPYPNVNGSLWTIEYEFRCYLLVLLLGISGFLKNRRVILGLWVLFLVLDAWPAAIKLLWNSHVINVLVGYPDLLARFGTFFLSGVVFHLFRARLTFSRRNILIAAGVLVTALFWKTSADIAVATAGAFLLFAFAFQHSPLLTRLTPRYDISYGTYLYGWPAQKVMLWYWPMISPWWLFFWSVVVSCLCGALSWLLVERPCLALKPSRPNTRVRETGSANGSGPMVAEKPASEAPAA